MREILLVFQGVEDPRRGNAKRHDLHETLVIALLTMLSGGRTCVDMEEFGHAAPGLKAIGKVTGERTSADGATSVDTRYFLLSAELSAERFAHVVRSHWAIENSLHWVLDVTMDEDQSRNRKDNAAACLAVVRRLALNIARMHPDDRPMRRKFLLAGWKPEYLFDMLRCVRATA